MKRIADMYFEKKEAQATPEVIMRTLRELAKNMVEASVNTESLLRYVKIRYATLGFDTSHIENMSTLISQTIQQYRLAREPLEKRFEEEEKLGEENNEKHN